MDLLFKKLHTCQSDYLVAFGDLPKKAGEIAKIACARRTGIGADGAAFITGIKNNKVSACFFNADGSPAGFCEGAARTCAQAVFLQNEQIADSLTISAHGESCEAQRLAPSLIKTTLKLPSFDADKIAPLKEKNSLINALCEVYGGGVYLSAIYSGMPFAAMLCDNVDYINLDERGAAFQNSRNFHSGINLVYIQIVNNDALKLRVYRHGCGEVTSCANAALAAHSCAARLGLCNKEKITVMFRSGALVCERNEKEAFIISDAHFIADICMNF